MRRRSRLDEEVWDESLPFIIGTGTFDSFTAVPNDDSPPKIKRQIGFIRKQDVQQISGKNSNKGKRKTTSRAPKKGTKNK